jgi:hypothetical protein
VEDVRVGIAVDGNFFVFGANKLASLGRSSKRFNLDKAWDR